MLERWLDIVNKRMDLFKSDIRFFVDYIHIFAGGALVFGLGVWLMVKLLNRDE